MNIVLKISLAFIIYTLIGCNSGVEIESIDANKLVSVSSFISPKDSIIRAYVFRGGVLGDVLNIEKAIIKNAVVTIFDENLSSKTLVFNSKSNSYIIESKYFKISPSQKYFLKVKTPDGIELNAECQVPDNPDMPAIKGVKNDNNFIFYLATPSKKIAYYSLSFDLVNVQFTPKLGSTLAPSLNLITDDLLFENQGTENTTEWTVYRAFYADKISLKTILISLDENAYRFLKTNRIASNWNNNTGNFFPNLQEPQPVYSNIKGGVGIFGAYNKVESITVIK